MKGSNLTPRLSNTQPHNAALIASQDASDRWRCARYRRRKIPRWYVKRLKGAYSSISEIRRRAPERHLPYGITQCYLPPDAGERGAR